LYFKVKTCGSFNFLHPQFTLKIAGLFQPKFGWNMDKLKWWVENII